MVEQLKEAIADNASVLTKGMAATNPFMAVLLIVLVIQFGWMSWDNHTMKKELVRIKLDDAELARDRNTQINDFTSQLLAMEQQDNEDRKLFVSMLESIESRDATQYESGKDYVADILQAIATVNEKLDLVINNQQIRSVIRAQPQGQP